MSDHYTVGEVGQLVSSITGQNADEIKGIILITIDQSHEPRAYGSLTRSGLLKVLASVLRDAMIAEAMGEPDVFDDDDRQPNPLKDMPADVDGLLRDIFGEEG